MQVWKTNETSFREETAEAAFPKGLSEETECYLGPGCFSKVKLRVVYLGPVGENWKFRLFFA